MITKNLVKALEEIGFQYSEGTSSDKSHAYAVYGGYLVTVYEQSGKKTAFFSFRFAENEENNLKQYEISEQFSSLIEEFGISDYTISEDGMRVVSAGNVGTFLKMIDKCIELLKEFDIRGIDYCSKCGNKFGSRKPKKVLYRNENHLMCEHCALDTVEEANANAGDAQDTLNSASPLKGILGCICGGILGALLYILLYYVVSPAIGGSGTTEFRYIFCVTGFFVALLCYYGYKLFVKRGCTAAYISVSVSAILFTAVGQYLGVVLEFLAKNSFSVSVLSNKHFWLIHLRNTIPADLTANIVSNSEIFWKLLIISILFSAVGAAIMLISLHEKSNIKPETVEIETLTIK